MKSSRVAPPFACRRREHDHRPCPPTWRLIVSWVRSSGAATVVRVLTIGVCAIPLAAGYADAHGIDRSRLPGTSSPERSPRAALPLPAGRRLAGRVSIRPQHLARRQTFARQALAAGRLCTAAGQRRPSATRRALAQPPARARERVRRRPAAPARTAFTRRAITGGEGALPGRTVLGRGSFICPELPDHERLARSVRQPRARIPPAGPRSRGRCRAGVAAAPATRAGIGQLPRVRPPNRSRPQRARASRAPHRPSRAPRARRRRHPARRPQPPRRPLPRRPRPRPPHPPAVSFPRSGSRAAPASVRLRARPAGAAPAGR